MKKNALEFCCSESFESMTPLEKNIRFCSSCKVIVKDFKNDKTVNNTNDCGNYNINQLEYISRIYKTSNYTKPITLMALLGLVVSNVSAKNFHNTGSIPQITNQEKLTTVTGKIVNDKTNKELAFVEVTATIKEKIIYSTTSDKNGNFKLEIDTNKYKITDIIIHFDFVGFESNTINYNPLPKELKIRMEARIPEIEECLITATGRISPLYNSKEIDSIVNSIEWVDEETIIEEEE